jgi:hypothetical protein
LASPASPGVEFIASGLRSVKVSGFRVKFTLQGGVGLFTSPPSETLELALKRAADLERESKATIEGIVGCEGYFALNRRTLATDRGRSA